ncbi:MAG TPA: ABC transporter permease [Victivallales bacterium]|nr:ABC transporter permease [Victivallales bacterium]HRR28161.1 ABC transporter permease [Victivallales bacterium]HRU00273.1 ABC transporter permease [Victivallales bacterium]
MRKNTESSIRISQRKSVIEHIGNSTLQFLKDIYSICQITGETAILLYKAVKTPKKIRWRESLYYMDSCGADAVPIVSTLCFIMGLIIGIQSALQLRKYGGDIFVADAVAYSIIKELAPFMVAIICTGRAGSAFAAEIGTMKVSEEIDAIYTMGLEPGRFLIVPKVLALVFVMPLLTMIGNLAGLLGGLSVAIIQLQMSFSAYYNRTFSILLPRHFAEGITKSIIFAFIISIIGCWKGLDSGNDAQGVGRAATSAVVTSIFLIVIADFAITMLVNVWF